MKNNATKWIVMALVVVGFTAGFSTVSKVIQTYGAITPTGPFRPISSLNAYENVYYTIYVTGETFAGGKVWNHDSKTFVATNHATVIGANYGNIAIACTDLRAQAEDGWIPTIPAEVKTYDGDFTCDLKFYDNAVPAATDAILLGRHCYIKTKVIGSTNTSAIWSMDDL